MALEAGLKPGGGKLGGTLPLRRCPLPFRDSDRWGPSLDRPCWGDGWCNRRVGPPWTSSGPGTGGVGPGSVVNREIPRGPIRAPALLPPREEE